MKLFNLLFLLLFVAFAALQYNDPDPWLWVPIYGYGAFCCWLALRRQYRPVFYWAGILFYAAYALYLFFDSAGVLSWARDHEAESLTQSMQAAQPWIEKTREFGGLLLLMLVLAFDLWWLKRHHAATSPS